MFFEELGKGGHRDIERVGAIVLLELRQIGLCGDASIFLELIDARFGFGIDLVRQGTEGLLGGIVEETALLEQERDIGLIIGLNIRIS